VRREHLKRAEIVSRRRQNEKECEEGGEGGRMGVGAGAGEERERERERERVGTGR